jgi:hypothetical protein
MRQRREGSGTLETGRPLLSAGRRLRSAMIRSLYQATVDDCGAAVRLKTNFFLQAIIHRLARYSDATQSHW